MDTSLLQAPSLVSAKCSLIYLKEYLVCYMDTYLKSGVDNGHFIMYNIQLIPN